MSLPAGRQGAAVTSERKKAARAAERNLIMPLGAGWPPQTVQKDAEDAAKCLFETARREYGEGPQVVYYAAARCMEQAFNEILGGFRGATCMLEAFREQLEKQIRLDSKSG